MTDSEPATTVASLGHAGRLGPADLALVRDATHHRSPSVRAVAVAALVRAAPVRVAAPAWTAATRDPAAAVRRRAAELAPALAARRRSRHPGTEQRLVDLLDDGDVTVVEAAAWALGELDDAASPTAVAALANVVTTHTDALAREAAVAALGAIGDDAGLAAVLAACRDKPAVRRRAVLALAPFDGPAVDAAIAAALEDRDWQVRQAAEDLRTAGTDG